MKRSIFLFFLIFLANAYVSEYKLGPEDILKINIYREEDLERVVKVSQDGFITLPLIGQIQAKDLTIGELEYNITEDLKEFIHDPQVTIFINDYGTVAVLGQVRKPGVFPLKGPLTVLEAIALAEGFTKISAKNDVTIISKFSNEKTKVRVDEISKKGKSDQDVFLHRGDIVYVPECYF